MEADGVERVDLLDLADIDLAFEDEHTRHVASEVLHDGATREDGVLVELGVINWDRDHLFLIYDDLAYAHSYMQVGFGEGLLIMGDACLVPYVRSEFE